MATEFVGALDQGTSSTRFLVFDRAGAEVAGHQLEHRQIFARDGWVEHDPEQIWQRCLEVVDAALRSAGMSPHDLAAIGITNQRETTVVWERASGRPIANAIVWQDTRTSERVGSLISSGHGERVRELTGLPLSSYSSATKLEWILAAHRGARERGARGELLFGTIDSWLTWKMTGRHVTDVTNASRTMLMNLATLDWDDELLELFGVPREMLPVIGPSTRPPGELVARGLGAGADGVAVTALLGDQQSAMVGQQCFSPGDAKCTYGTGSFLLVHTGTTPTRSAHGLISTVAYQLAGSPPAYALEGAIAVTGSAVQWLRDNLGVIERAEDSEALARSVADSDGLYFVPALSGLLAPYWRPDARGVLVGMSRAHTRAHLARATLESVAFQTLDVVRTIEEDLGTKITELRVDGGMTANSLCMQLQADVLGVPVLRNGHREATALGAAFAAGLAAGTWAGIENLPSAPGREDGRFDPTWDEERRVERSAGWRRAVEASLDWAKGVST